MDQKTIAHKPINVAIVGAGVIGRTHAEALEQQSDVELKVICDADITRAKALAKEYGVEETVEEFEELLQMDDIHVLIMGTPHFLHKPHIKGAANAGKHILVEKPLANSLDDVDELIELANSRGILLGTIFQNRYFEGARRIKELCANKELGKIVLVQVTVKWERSQEYYDRARWRSTYKHAGGGVLMTQAIHMLDFMQWFAGPISSVTASTKCISHAIEVEDTAVGICEFASGALGVIAASVSTHPETAALIEVHGELGSAALAEHRGSLTYAVKKIGDDTAGHPATECLAYFAKFGSHESTVPTMRSDLHAAVFADFFNALHTGESFSIDANEARSSLALLDAVYRSSSSASRENLR